MASARAGKASEKGRAWASWSSVASGASGLLEAVGLSPQLPDYARPLVVIDTQGHPLDCLPRTLPAREQAQVIISISLCIY